MLTSAVTAARGKWRRRRPWPPPPRIDTAPENVSKLFDPFFTTKPPGEGTGLGLPISRNIVVKRHHGEVTVESAPGRTRFAVRLPLDVVPADDPPED